MFGRVVVFPAKPTSTFIRQRGETDREASTWTLVASPCPVPQRLSVHHILPTRKTSRPTHTCQEPTFSLHARIMSLNLNEKSSPQNYCLQRRPVDWVSQKTNKKWPALGTVPLLLETRARTPASRPFDDHAGHWSLERICPRPGLRAHTRTGFTSPLSDVRLERFNLQVTNLVSR